MGGTSLTHLSTYSAIIRMTEGQTHRSVDQNRKPRNGPSQLIFDKGAKGIQYKKYSLFNKWYCSN